MKENGRMIINLDLVLKISMMGLIMQANLKKTKNMALVTTSLKMEAFIKVPFKTTRSVVLYNTLFITGVLLF